MKTRTTKGIVLIAAVFLTMALATMPVQAKATTTTTNDITPL